MSDGQFLDSSTRGLMFARPIPQGTAPPEKGAFWTDEYGWLVPTKPCEHGNYTRHIPHHRGNSPRYLSNGDLEWCDGSEGGSDG